MNGGASPEAHIEAHALCRTFGARRALDRVDLVVPEGRCLAVFGPNGAGKTTLVRVLTLGLKPSGGTFRIASLSPRTDDVEIRRRIGVISHQSFLYDDLSARQNLEFYGRLYGAERPAERAAALLDEVGLAARADDAVRGFSRGMQQRVSIARALVHDPRIVFLDEPFTGLDPYAARTLRGMLDRLRRERRTVLLVTHNLAEGLELSDDWVILARGRVVARGASATVDAAELERVYFRHFAGDRPGGPS